MTLVKKQPEAAAAYRRPEKLTIIGGGLEGCLAALFAARVPLLDEQGNAVTDDNGKPLPQYEVTLLEASDHILSGTSMAAARLHLGGEYPKDLRTATDCMWGAMLWKLIMPPDVFTSVDTMRYLIAKGTQQEAVQGNPSAITFEDYKKHYEKLKDQYHSMASHVASALRKFPEAAKQMHIHIPDTTPPADIANPTTQRQSERLTRWQRQQEQLLIDQVQSVLFGPEREFYSQIPPGDLNTFGGSMQGGLATQEPGLDITGYLSALQPALEEAGVRIVTRARVESVSQKKDGGYVLQCDRGQRFECDQLIQAAWAGGFALDHAHRDAQHQKKVHVYNRAMAVVDIHDIPLEELPHVIARDGNGNIMYDEEGKPQLRLCSCFALKGGHGGMFSPLNEDMALVYHPVVAHLGETTMDSSDPSSCRLPKSWKRGGRLEFGERVDPATGMKTPRESAEELLEDYKEALVGDPQRGKPGAFPFLKHAAFRKLLIRPTLNFDPGNDIDKRRHEPTEEIKPGYHVMYATKLTLAPASAIEAVEDLRLRSRYKKMGDAQRPLERHVALNKAFMTVLADPVYDIQKQLHVNNPDDVYRFMLERGWELPASNLLALRTPWDGWALPEEPSDSAPPGHYPLAVPAQSGQPDVSRRGFGIGFGPHKIDILQQSAPKTGYLFGDRKNNEEVCRRIKDWVSSADAPALGEVLSPQQLSAALSNRLLHGDQLQLLEIAAMLESPEGQGARSLLFCNRQLSHIPPELWSVIRKSRPALPQDPQKLVSITKSSRVANDQREAMAALLPVVFEMLTEEEKARAAHMIADMLHVHAKDKSIFEPLIEPELNRLHVANADELPKTQKISNQGGRSLQINCQEPASLEPTAFHIRYQGKDFYPVQFHVHRNKGFLRDSKGNYVYSPTGGVWMQPGVTNTDGKPDGQFEYMLYDDAKSRVQAGTASRQDPNRHSVGELHAVFMSTPDQSGYRDALALCAHIVLGKEDNPGLSPYIHSLEILRRPLERDEAVQCSLPFNPMKCFNHGGFEGVDGLAQAPFASLNLGRAELDGEGRAVLGPGASDIFYRGVHVVHLPDTQSVTISPHQLEVLERAQPVLSPLHERLGVWPIARASGRELS